VIHKLINKYSNRFVSNWVILGIDLLLVLFLFLFAYLVRFNFNFITVKQWPLIYQTPYVLGIFALFFTIFSSYSGIIRHTTLEDSVKIFLANTLASVFIALITYLVQSNYNNHVLNIPFSVVIIHYLLCSFVLINSRFLFKIIYNRFAYPLKEPVNVLIYGAGNLGLITKHSLYKDKYNNYKVTGFIEDNSSMQRKIIEGVRVYSPEQVFSNGFIYKEHIREVVIAINEISATQKREIANKCLAFNLKVKTVPSVQKWLHDDLNINQINNVRIEDLLGRDSIYLDKKNIINGIKGKNILITGAAGSIGSEIVRQVSSFEPNRIILFDQAESPLYELNLELNNKWPTRQYDVVIGDINNRANLEKLFEKYNPEIIFHAAAYKHVPLMESAPHEAVHTNVGGTKNIADFAIKNNVKRFVLISTDKAVNPTNVMGATKRMAEMYVRCLDKSNTDTQFITTRFGNVLGSNGSVIPLFKKQIEAGGPVTVTHPEVTRFFMTISEACQLVLEAAFMGKDGEIFVFDMGESVKIMDLAKKMIKLSGLELQKDIDIAVTGLRDGEKLYEELLANEENTKPTHNPKIMIADLPVYDRNENINRINKLLAHAYQLTDEQIVYQVKQIVPEFLSHNSKYKQSDNNGMINKNISLNIEKEYIK
jgi:FlaA1/EpsC-like NDP-sugar epimerase